MTLSASIITKRCTDPPMPHQMRHDWAERMRVHEASQPDMLAQDDASREAQRMAKAHRVAAATEADNPYFTPKERASRALWHQTKAAEWEAKIVVDTGKGFP
jgi:hypothetical protein